MTEQPHHTGWAVRPEWLVLALMLASLLLRTVDLQRRPLHFDEGINVTMGYRSPAEVLDLSRQTFDNDPPGHRFTLGAWMALAGPSPFAIRIFSVFFSLLAVALTYRIAREMKLGFWPAFIAAGLMAVSPYAIDYAQQAKGYAMGIGMTMLSWWMWLRLCAPKSARSRRLAHLALYVFSTALALGTHYYTLFVLPMQWLWYFGVYILEQKRSDGPGLLGLLRAAQTRRRIGQAIAAQIIACIPIGIWLALMATSLQVSTVRSSSTMQRSSFLALITRILGEMSVGQFADSTLALLGMLVLVAGMFVGALRLQRWKADPRRQALWFGLAFGVPLAGALVMQFRVSFFFPRFLLYALPNLCVLIAGCTLPAHSRKAAAGHIPAFALAAVLVVGLFQFYQAPIDDADDYRPIISQVRPLIKPGDAALGTYIWMEGMFTSYAPETAGTLHWYDERYAPATVDALLAPIAKSSARIWSVNFRRDPDAPTTLSVTWLKQHAAYAERYAWGVTSVLLFDTRLANAAPAGAQHSATFDHHIQLDYAPISQTAQPGDTVVVLLQWSALSPIDDEPTIYLHLLSPSGQLVSQNDGDAVNGLAPAFTWVAGRPIRDQRAILIPAALPPGDYALTAGVYDRARNTRLLTSDNNDGVVVGSLQVTCATHCP
jgi:uncharacterized membrane protein